MIVEIQDIQFKVTDLVFIRQRPQIKVKNILLTLQLSPERRKLH